MKKDIGKTLKTIQDAEGNQQISKDQANKLAYTALSSMVGEPTVKPTNLTQEKEVQDLIKSQSQQKAPNIKINRGAESVEVSEPKTGSTETLFDYTVPGLVPIIAQPSNMTCWATVAAMMMSWKDNVSYTIETAMDKAGVTYRAMFDANQGLLAAGHEAFATACSMSGEPPTGYTVSGLRGLIELHGPIIVIADEAPGSLWAIHARVVRGIYGDGTVDGTFLRINDPAVVVSTPSSVPSPRNMKKWQTRRVCKSCTSDSPDHGGWITSPAGAYVLDTTLAGKATFGFVSKYQKGATVPGNTEFQFKVADLNFKSTSYDWLVVAGHRLNTKALELSTVQETMGSC